ncbi:MAG: glutathione S-transferase [Pseudomonadota bacterium]
MQLYYTPIRGYVHTVEALVAYAGLRERLVPVPTKPYAPDTPLPAVNPLGKVPTLVLDDGSYLAGGPVIYEYLDSLHDREPLYPTPPARWQALRRAWLADGLFDQLVLLIVEGWVAKPAQRPDYARRCWDKVVRALDRLELDAATPGPLDIGHVRTVGALAFLDLKGAQIAADLESALPEAQGVAWRDGRTRLAEWYARERERAIYATPLLPDP